MFLFGELSSFRRWSFRAVNGKIFKGVIIFAILVSTVALIF